MSTILVVANETLGGASLLEAIDQKAGPDDRIVVCVPRNRPREGRPFDVTLVVANRTASGDELLECLRAKKGERQHLFIVVVPQEGGGGTAAQAARGRLGQVLDRLRAQNILCAGMIGDPDPYTA